jgi:uncharacterized protein (DUF1800 family)
MKPKLFGSILSTVGRILALAFFTTGAVSAALDDSRLANLSSRAQVGTGANIMVTGFVIGEGGPKKVLLRAIGPGLDRFSVAGTLTRPVLSLYDRNGALLTTNSAWSANDATTMTGVGAFPLVASSRDAAIVTTLSPGLYTAQVSSADGGSGVALLEAYDVSGPARLINMSTRARVGAGDNTLIAGLVISPGNGTRRLLVRAVGPTLAAFNVPGANPDPALAVLNSQNTQIATNDNWENGNAIQLTAAFTQAGAFALPAGSKDAALITELAPGNYSVLVSGVNGAAGVALVEIYDITAKSASVAATVSVTATNALTDLIGGAPGVFTVSRTGSTDQSVTISYTLSGSAVSGTDFQSIAGNIALPAGSASANVTITPIANSANTSNRDVTLTLSAPTGYGVANASATVGIFATAPSLYVSYLRAQSAATGSTAYGTATIQLSADESGAYVNVTFANLTSAEVVAHLVLDGNFVYGLPTGQVTAAYWTFNPVGTYTKADLIAALKAGRITVSIDTAKYPSGELGGTFVRNNAGAFTVPNAPPTVDLNTLTPKDAARFLIQASFGATTPDVTDVVKKGYAAWLDDQLTLPATPHRAYTMSDFVAANLGGQGTSVNGVYPYPGGIHRQAAWWKIVLTAPDQLRQRVAFALSEIFVVSDQDANLNTWQEGMASYYDVLVANAFGNFRSLLEDVTLHPIMGVYLSALRNGRGGVDPNGVAITSANENFAREIMQLFTIGLNELNPDGTLKLDANGQLIPTYDQTTINETAKVFTGWAFSSTAGNRQFRSTGGYEPRDWTIPMLLYPDFHDDSAKIIVGGKALPAGQGGAKDLKDTLDTLFNHPNTGPFIARQLIQRLVTSNPSPGYIYRIAQVFANNGSGVRGDLGAVVRAILLDYEARSLTVATAPGQGKLKEPLLRATAFMRAFGARSDSGRYNIDAYPALAEAALRAPTVFNFFEPGFIGPGALARASLTAPEFQIVTDTTAITSINFYNTYINNLRPAIPSPDSSEVIYLQLDNILPLAKSPQALVDQLNLLLSASALAKTSTDIIVAALTALPSDTDDLERVRTAIYLVVNAPEGATQK